MHFLSEMVKNNPYLVVAAWCATILPVIYSIFSNKKRITVLHRTHKYQLNQLLSYSKMPEKRLSGINAFKEKNLLSDTTQVFVTSIELRNKGKSLVDYKDVYEGHSLSFLISNIKNTVALSAELVGQSSVTNNCQILQIDSNCFQIHFDALEPNEVIEFDIYQTYQEKPKLEVNGKIRDTRLDVTNARVFDWLTSDAMTFIAGGSTFTMIALFSGAQEAIELLTAFASFSIISLLIYILRKILYYRIYE